MRKLLLIIVAVLSVSRLVFAGTSSSFIYPVMGDGKSAVSNTVDPRSLGWYVNNGFGSYYPSNPVKGTCSTCDYHPAEDWNRNDAREDTGNGEQVYSIGSGVIARIVNSPAYGSTILVRYELDKIEDLSKYFLPGTIPSQQYKTSKYVVAQYMHIFVDSSLIEGKGVKLGQVLGTIRTDYRHLHFELMSDPAKSNASTARNLVGYYTSQQSITDYGYIDPSKFIADHIGVNVVKFTDSKVVYLYSNNQLWPILNETVYALLGFRKDCNTLTPDWTKVVVLPATSRSSYTIRSDVVGSPGLPPERKISYRVNSAACLVGPYDSTKLYALLNENGQIKFHHITDWDSYLKLGYNANSRDIVDMPYEFLQSYGESDAIGPSNVTSIATHATSFLSSYSTTLEINSTNTTGTGGGFIPSTPTNFNGNVTSDGQIQLYWSASSGSMEVEYLIYRKKDGDSGDPIYWSRTYGENIRDEGIIIGQTYCYQISSLYNGEESLKSNMVCISVSNNTTTNSTNGFTYIDIGTDTPRGKVTYNSDTNRYVVNGTGNGITGNSTQCKFYYKEQSNCSTVTTRVISHSAIGPGAMSGIMFANNTNSNSDFALLAVTPDKGIVFQYRQNGIIYSQGGDTFDYPVYLRLIDSGSKFTAQYSTTGNSSDWLTISTIIFSLTSNYQVGLFATPASSIVSSAVFEGLKVNSRPEKPTGIRIH